MCEANQVDTLVFRAFFPTVFFKPTEALRPPEPTVEVGGAIYLDDTTADEAAEDARTAAAVERPAKRQKVVDLVDEENLNEIDSPTEDEDEDEDEDDDNEDEDVLPDPAAQGGL